jgi:DNA-binding PadR family transcriptional regulator
MNTSNNALTEATYYILLALVTPLHGYGIMQRTAELSSGRLMISAGTLYGALSTLMEKGWIEQLAVITDSRKKEYLITDIGLTVLRGEVARLEELVVNGRKILEQTK